MQTVFAFPKVTKALLLAADCGRGSGGADLSSAHCCSVGGRASWAPESLPPSLPCTPVTGTTNSTSLLVFVLSEQSGLVAPSLSNFPHPSRTRFLPGIVVARQKAAWLSCLLLSECRLLLGGRAHCVHFSILPPPPSDYEDFTAKILTFSSASLVECLAQGRLPMCFNQLINQ